MHGLAHPTLIDALRHHVAAKPDHVLYRFVGASQEEPEDSLTFRQLDESARQIATSLGSERAGCRALLLYPPGLEFISAFLGCLYAGVIAVPVYLPNNRRESWARLEAIARDCEADLVLIDAHHDEGVTRWLSEETAPRLTRIITTARNSPPVVPVLPDIQPERVAFLQYTSGSTGDPKGVVVTHANLIHNEEVIRDSFGHGEDDIIAGWLPQYHDMGLIGSILQPLFLGATAVLMAPASFLQRPARWLEVISRYRATTSGGPDFAYRLCVERVTEEQKAGLDLSSWALAFNGAEPVQATTMEEFTRAFASQGFRRTAFYPCYGLAEGTLMATGSIRQQGFVSLCLDREAVERNEVRLSESPASHSSEYVSSGLVVDQVGVRIVDPVTGHLCPPNRIGEIWLSGPSVATGYWGRDEESRATFHAISADLPGRHLRTGDLGFVYQGHLFVTGRLKDLIIIRGRNLYPQDVETHVQRCFPDLQPGAGACFASNAGGEERLVLVQEVKRTAIRTIDYAALWHEIAQTVSEVFGVKLCVLSLVKPLTVPKTSSGKVRRRACRQLFESGQISPLAVFPQSTEPTTINVVAGSASSPGLALLAEKLGIGPEQLDRMMPLTAYGLDSLRAAELEDVLKNRLGVNFDLARLLEGARVGEVLDAIAAAPPAPELPGPEAEGRIPHTSDMVSAYEEAIWQAQARNPDGSAFTLAVPLRLSEKLDSGMFDAALQWLTTRHPRLTTRLVDVRGQLTAVGGHRISLRCIDARGWSDTDLASYLASLSSRQLDPATDPVFQVSLIDLHEGCLLHILVHHIVVDAWTLQFLVRELLDAYAQIRSGFPPSAATVPSYDQFVVSEADWLAGAEGRRARERYARLLRYIGDPLNLPRELSPRPRPSADGRDFDLLIEPPLANQLKQLAQRQGLTLFSLLLSAYQTLLMRITGQQDFSVGVPVSVRPLDRHGGTAGCFVDLKLVPSRVDPDITFAQLAARTRETVLEILATKRVPSRVALRDAGINGTVPNVRFALQQAQLLPGCEGFLFNLEGRSIELAGLRLETCPIETQTAAADLSLTVLSDGDGLIARFNYRTEVLRRARMETIARAFKTLLRSILADQGTPLARLPVLDREERDRLIAKAAPRLMDLPEQPCIHQLIEEQVRQRPEAIAIECGTERLTYAQMNRRANAIARRLQAEGVKPEDRIALYLDRSADMAVAFLAALKAGACSVMLEPSLPPERTRHIIASSRPSLLLVNHDRLEVLIAGMGRLLDIRTIEVGPTEPDLNLPLTRDTATYVIHTSGSTGQPKGVVGRHEGLVNRTCWMIRQFGLGPDDGVLHTTPMGFVRAEREILFPLAAGARLVILPTEAINRPEPIVSALEKYDITFTASAPSLLQMILDQDRERFARLGRLRRWFIGADVLRPNLVREIQRTLPNLALTYFYGSTEVSSDVAWFDLPVGYATDAAIVPIGHALPNTSLHLLDRHMEPVPDGMPGEIYVGGVQLARGYLDDPDQTAEKFIRDPFCTTDGARLYRTGDMGFRMPDGGLVVAGRSDDQVNIYGHRVELREIEHQLRQLDGIRDAVVLAERTTSEHILIIGYVVAPQDTDLTSVRDLLTKRLPSYMIPTALVRLEHVPVTPLGKVDRTALRGMTAAALHQPDHVAPETPLERAIGELLAELLGIPPDVVSVERNFFELGANSAVLSQLTARLNRRDGMPEVRITQIYQHSTVRALAAALDMPGADQGESGTAGRAERRRAAWKRLADSRV